MIKYYEYNGGENENWEFSAVLLSKINLLVGASGSGKTRFLNTLFNFSEFVTNGRNFRFGIWKLKITAGNSEYDWNYEGSFNDDGEHIVKSEVLIKINDGTSIELVRRDEKEFFFKGVPLPKLEKDIPSVSLLKEEELIKPLYNVFAHVMRRRFHDNALNDAVAIEGISKKTIDKFTKKSNLDEFWVRDRPIQSRLYLFNKFFKEKYKVATEFLISVFPTIEATEIRFLTEATFGKETIVPIFFVKEKGVKDLIPLQELSSGMQKVLLIITDILSLTQNCIYIIDEYENSLGINAINFLPEFLLNYGGDNQFIITTHHPYLINNMPMKNWLVFNRNGSSVNIKNGSEFEEKFGKSKQKAFVQLISDPFYSGE
jgi:AAA15 family ATPase/GTPase